MTLAVLFILVALGLLFMAWRGLRDVRRGDWAKAAGTRLLVAPPPREEAPQLSLESGRAVLFGPEPATWRPPVLVSRALGNADGEAGRPGGPVAAGTYRVAEVVDLRATEGLGTGDASLDEAVRAGFGPVAMLLEPASGGASILLHGQDPQARGSTGGIAIAPARMEALLGVVGDPRGMQVDVLRRDIRRSGWGQPRGGRTRRR